jgi:membrane associated rhomboid family serine protease
MLMTYERSSAAVVRVKTAEEDSILIPLRDTIPSRRSPFAMWTIVALNVVVFLYELQLDPPSLEQLFFLFGLVPARYGHPELAASMGLSSRDYLPFLSCMFLHGGWAHLVGNMWTLWIFGDNVEDRMGHARFTVFYLLMGVSAGLVHWLTNRTSLVPTVGASGAIAGVLGAYFLLFPHSRIIAVFPIFLFPFFFELPAAVYLLVWFLSQTLSGTLAGLSGSDVGGIAWWAHVGGFCAGAVLHRLFLLPESKSPRRFEPDEGMLEGAWARRPRAAD